MARRSHFCLAALLACLLITAPFPQCGPAEAACISEGEAVVEVTSGRVLFSEGAGKRLAPASTTKILTALIILEDCRLDEVVEVPESAAGTEGSSVYLTAGEKITVRDLLHGLMLRSGNDCAVTLALYHSGSIGAFADCMNRRAAELGAENCHFTNPHGLPDAEHYVTANGLAAIAAAALQNESFSAIVGTKTYTEESAPGRVWQNKNKMLYQYNGADGVKTGYTQQAGRCLVSSATRGGMRLVCVVLNSPQMYERSAELLDACFAKYAMRQLFRAENAHYAVPTDVPEKICRAACEDDFSYPMAEGEQKELRTVIRLPEQKNLPVHKGEILGDIEIYFRNQLIFSQKIVSIVDIEKSYLDILREIARS